MSWKHSASWIGLASVLAPVLALACTTERPTPKTLVDARAEVLRAQDGFAMRLDPTDAHEASVALQRAEQAWRDAPDDPSTDDLAILADRWARIAEAQAGVLQAQLDSQHSADALAALKAQRMQAAQAQLAATKDALGATEMQLRDQRATDAVQAQRLQELETRLKDARDTIAKIATVKDDERGMVISLPGEVLFKTDKFDLKPAALAKLDQIANALRSKDQPFVVYGYTDGVGTREHNMDLSDKRAQAVRDYLVSKGLPKDTVTSEGKGPDDPVADNGSVEGRAQNRRVEIVVQPKR
jgi:outer membrane protein OmpA-like peptidoglycan-associated protein